MSGIILIKQMFNNQSRFTKTLIDIILETFDLLQMLNDIIV
jgi:hypothetical protein